MSKIGQAVLKILTKRWFLRVKCRHYGKIRIFRKWPLGPFYDPPCPLTSCKKSENVSNERILRKLRKTLFLDCPLVYFWTRPSMNASFIALFLGKLVAVFISFIISHILTKKEQNRSNGSCDIDEKVMFARKMPPLWKNQNFRKMAARPILWPTMLSNFMQKIRKI